jgi:TonB family protein
MIELLFHALAPALALSAAGSASSDSLTAQDAANSEFIVKNYPVGPMKRGEQGRVAFRLTIEPEGSVSRCEVTESSGFAGLDNETCEIMVYNARLSPVRNEDGRSIRATQNGFIVWRLPGSPTPVAAAAATTMPKPDDLICKRSRQTGSLIAATKQCLTKKQWLMAEQEAREAAERIQGKGHCAEGGCLPYTPPVPPGFQPGN